MNPAVSDIDVTTTKPASPRVSASPRDRVFYGSIAFALALTVFVGFGPTYYFPIFSNSPASTLTGGPVTPLVHVHAALFSAWVLLFIAQTTLVAQRRIAVHRHLGIAGGLFATLMVVVGTLTALRKAARGEAPGGVDPHQFLMIPLSDIAFFGGFVAAALLLRRNGEAHKRLMLLAYVSIVVAAVGRLPGVLPLGPPAFFALMVGFPWCLGVNCLESVSTDLSANQHTAARLLAVGAYTGHDGVVSVAGNPYRDAVAPTALITPHPPRRHHRDIGRPRQVGSTPNAPLKPI